MSYEGYEQVICARGHLYNGEDSYMRGEKGKCPICGAEPVWSNSVDETNCDSYGQIPDELLEKHFGLTPEITEKCNLGHLHVVAHATYGIPMNDETHAMRHYRKGDGRDPLIPLYPDELKKLTK